MSPRPSRVVVAWNEDVDRFVAYDFGPLDDGAEYVRADLVRALLKTYDDAAAGRLDWDEYQRAMTAVKEALG